MYYLEALRALSFWPLGQGGFSLADRLHLFFTFLELLSLSRSSFFSYKLTFYKFLAAFLRLARELSYSLWGT